MTTVPDNSATNITPEQPLHAEALLPAGKFSLPARIAELAA